MRVIVLGCMTAITLGFATPSAAEADPAMPGKMLAAAAEALPQCLTPLARAAQKEVRPDLRHYLEEGMARLKDTADRGKESIADARRFHWPLDAERARVISHLADTAARHVFVVGVSPEIQRQAAQCVTAACDTIGDHLSRVVCEGHASDLRQSAGIGDTVPKPPPRLGMTAEEVENGTSWGGPLIIDRHRTVTATGVREQWVCIRPSGRGYLYFENGILTAIED